MRSFTLLVSMLKAMLLNLFYDDEVYVCAFVLEV